MECSNAYPKDYTMNNLCARNALEPVYPIDLHKEYQCQSEYQFSKEFPLNPDVTNFDSHSQNASDCEKQHYLQALDVTSDLYPNYCLESLQDKKKKTFFHGYPKVGNLPLDSHEERSLHPFTKEKNIFQDGNLSVYIEESRQLWQNILQNNFQLHPEEKSNYDSEYPDNTDASSTAQLGAVERTLDHLNAFGNISSVENENLGRDLSSNFTVNKRNASQVEHLPNYEKHFQENSMEESCQPSNIFHGENNLSVENSLTKRSCHEPRLPTDEWAHIPDRSNLRSNYLQISFDKPNFPPESVLGGKEYPEGASNASSLPIPNGERRNLTETSNAKKFVPKVLYDERNHCSKASYYENSCLTTNHCMEFFPLSSAFNNDTFNEQQSCLPYKVPSLQDSRSPECTEINTVKNSRVNWLDDCQLKKRSPENHFKDATASTSCCRCPKTSFRNPLQKKFVRRCCERRSHLRHFSHTKLKLDRSHCINKPSETISPSKFCKAFSQSDSEINKMQHCDSAEKPYNVPSQAKVNVEQYSIYVKSKDELNNIFIKTKNNMNSMSINFKADINKQCNISKHELNKWKAKEILNEVKQHNERELSYASPNRSDTTVKNNSYNIVNRISLDHSYCKLSEPIEIILD